MSINTIAQEFIGRSRTRFSLTLKAKADMKIWFYPKYLASLHSAQIIWDLPIIYFGAEIVQSLKVEIYLHQGISSTDHNDAQHATAQAKFGAHNTCNISQYSGAQVLNIGINTANL